MFNDLVGTMPNRDPAEEQARQIIERLGLGGQIPAFNQSLPQTGGYGGPATPMPYFGGRGPEIASPNGTQSLVDPMTPRNSMQLGGLTPQQSAMVMGATGSPEQQAYGMVNRLLGSTQADAFANRDKNAAYNMISNHPALGQAQADAFMNRGTVNRQPDYYGLGAGVMSNYTPPEDPAGPSYSERDLSLTKIRPRNQPQGRFSTLDGLVGDLPTPPPIPDINALSSGAVSGAAAGPIGTNAAYQAALANAGVSGAVGGINAMQLINDGRGASEAARGGAWGGIQGNPFYMGERPAPGHQLGYTGSFMGSSRGWVDDSEGRAWDARAARNLEINRMLGNQELGRQANATDALRTMLNVDQRREASMDRKEGKTWDIINKTPEGQRKGILIKGMQEGVIPQEAGKGMLVDEVLKRATTGTRSKDGVINIPAFLAKLQAEWDPAIMDGNMLIDRFHALGITPDMIDKYKDDPAVGNFAKSVLGPPKIQDNAIGSAFKGIQKLLY